MQTIGWGVLGPGRIARSLVEDLALVPDGRLVATGSRAEERAAAFAGEYGGRAYGSYEALVADPEVDVVYVATPHALHDAHVRLALEAGKAVLCEKPMTLDAASTVGLFHEAETRGLFLMEAMWMACHPMVRTLLRLLATGDYGTPRQVHADLGFVVRAEPTDRMLDLSLGAGALLDMGIYPVTLAHLVLGEPVRLEAVADVTETGVDMDVAIAGLYPGGATAALTASMSSCSPRTATIATELGRFDFPENAHHPEHIRWTSYDEPSASTWLEPDEPVIGRGYGHEIVEVHRCLREGRLTSDLVPPAQTISIMRQLDAVLTRIGVSYGDSGRR